MAQQLPLIESRPEPTEVTPGTRPGPRSSRRAGQRPASGTGPARAGRARPGRAFAVAEERPGVLVEIPAADWHIDEHTKAVGRAGVAAARQALAAALRRAPGAEGDRSAA